MVARKKSARKGRARGKIASKSARGRAPKSKVTKKTAPAPVAPVKRYRARAKSTKKRTKKPAPKKAIKRVKKPAPRAPRKRALPTAKYREPIKPEKLSGLEARDAAHAIAVERKLFTARLQETLRTVRQFFEGFEASDGYPLDAFNVVRIHPSKLKRLRRVHELISRARSYPHVTFAPRNEAERKAAIARAGELGPGQKIFIIHHADAATATARYVPDESGGDEYGTIEITTKVKGGAVMERIYYFAQQPKTWRGVIKQTELLMSRGMRSGIYKIYNSLYGPIGRPTQREKMDEVLGEFWSTYNKWLAGKTLGWVWIGTTADSAWKREAQQQQIAERFKEARDDMNKQAEKKLKRKLGIKPTKKKKKPRPK